MTRTRSSVFALLGAACCLLSQASCHAPEQHTARISFDISKLAQSSDAQPIRLSLIVIGGAAPVVEDKVAEVETKKGETQTLQSPSASEEERPEAAIIVPPDSETTTGNTPARQVALKPEMKLSISLPPAEDSATPRQTAYFELSADETKTTFTLDVPSGPKQTLMLFGFVGTEALPRWTAVAQDVALLPSQEQEIVFSAYKAGVVVAEVLPPPTLGLLDTAGKPISQVPDMQSLCVAYAVAPKHAFPAKMPTLLPVGSIDEQVSRGSAPRVFVLPEGNYRIDCYANYAGKLFGFPNARPVEVEVTAGKMVVASGSLVKLKDLVPPPTGSDPSGGTNTLPARLPRFEVSWVSSTVYAAREVPNTETTPIVPPGSTSPNFDTLFDRFVTVRAINDDGSTDLSFSGTVQLRVVPAFDKAGMGKQVGVLDRSWQPFSGNLVAAAPTLDVFVNRGMSAPIVLAVTSHKIDTQVRPTFQYFLVAQARAVDDSLLDPGGVAYFTVRDNTACDTDTTVKFDRWGLRTLSEDNGNSSVTVLRRLDGAYEFPRESLFVFGLSYDYGVEERDGIPSRCSIAAHSSDTLLFLGIPDKLSLLTPPFKIYESSSRQLDVGAAAQSIFYESLSAHANIATLKPELGVRYPLTMTGLSSLGSQSFEINLTAVVKLKR